MLVYLDLNPNPRISLTPEVAHMIKFIAGSLVILTHCNIHDIQKDKKVFGVHHFHIQ